MDEEEHDRRPVGRPPKVDARGVPTRERLLAAGARAFVEDGFEATRLADIATRAEVSAPAIYNHFAGKEELLVGCAQWALERVKGDGTEFSNPRALAHRYVAPEFEEVRKLLLELHVVSHRHPKVKELLAQWHLDYAEASAEAGFADHATIKAMYLLLLGLSQLDAVSGLDVDPDALRSRVDRMIDALFD